MGNVWLGEKDAIDVTDAVKWKGLLGEEHTYWEDEIWGVWSSGGSLNTWLCTHRKEVEFVKDIKLLVESDKNAKKIMENYSYEEAKKNLVHPSHNSNLTVADFIG